MFSKLSQKISFQISKVTIMNNGLFSWNTFININQPHRTNKTIASQYCSWKTVSDLPVQQQANGQAIYNTSRPAVWTPLPFENYWGSQGIFIYLGYIFVCCNRTFLMRKRLKCKNINHTFHDPTEEWCPCHTASGKLYCTLIMREWEWKSQIVFQ